MIDRHLLSGPPVKDGNLLRPQSERRPCRIHRCISSSHHSYPLADFQVLFQIDHPHKGHTVNDTLEVLSGNSQFFSLVGSGSNVDGLILSSQTFQVELFSDRSLSDDLYSQPSHLFNRALNNLTWKPVGRNSDIKHAPGDGER